MLNYEEVCAPIFWIEEVLFTNREINGIICLCFSHWWERDDNMIKMILVLCIFIITIFGCSEQKSNLKPIDIQINNNSSSDNNQEELDKQKNADIAEIMATSSYFKNPNAIESKVSTPYVATHKLALGNIIISAEENSISVFWDNESVYFPKDNNYISLSYATLSTDQVFLSIQVALHEGYKTYVLDLNNKEVENISDQEVVANPRWSPIDKKMILFTGSISSQNITLFDPLKKSSHPLTKSFISLFSAKWDQDAKFIDFVAEEPSNSFSIYRLYLDSKEIINYGEITLEQFYEWDNEN